MKWASDEHMKNVKVIHPEDGTPPYHAKFVTGMYLPLSEFDEALIADVHQAKVMLDALQKTAASLPSSPTAPPPVDWKQAITEMSAPSLPASAEQPK